MPNRIIRESIQTSRTVNALSDFDYRIMTYLWVYVDDFGRGSADPDLLIGRVFPRLKGITKPKLASALVRLEKAGMITLYTVNGEKYLVFVNWNKYQTPRAKISKYPAPPRTQMSDLSDTCKQMQADEIKCKQTQANVVDIRKRYSIFDNDIREARAGAGVNESARPAMENGFSENYSTEKNREHIKQALLALKEE